MSSPLSWLLPIHTFSAELSPEWQLWLSLTYAKDVTNRGITFHKMDLNTIPVTLGSGKSDHHLVFVFTGTQGCVVYGCVHASPAELSRRHRDCRDLKAEDM